MTTVKLDSGYEMPLVGLGTWQSSPDQVKKAVEYALSCGYKHLDCALIYGNEKEIGLTLRGQLGKVIERKDLFVTSKLWCTYFNPNDVRKGCLKTLSDLQLDYLDLYLIHFPVAMKDGENVFPSDGSGNLLYADHDPCDTWKAMEKLVDEGLVRSIGISNFNSQQVDAICAVARIKPAMNQVECHPYFQQKPLLDHCKKHGIKITAYSPLTSLNHHYIKPDDPKILEDPVLTAMAKKYNKTIAQLCIRWQVQRGVVAVPKSVTPSRIKENSTSSFAYSRSREIAHAY